MLLRYFAKSSFRALSFCCTPSTATTTAAIDLFVFYAPSSVLLCKLCGYAVPPTALATHISNHHLSDARDAATSSLASSKSRKSAKLLADLSASDSSSSTQRQQRSQLRLQQIRQFQSFNSIAATSALAASLYVYELRQLLYRWARTLTSIDYFHERKVGDKKG